MTPPTTPGEVRITGLEATVLSAPNPSEDENENTVLVAVTTDAGVTGYGEANAAPEVVKAYLDRSDGADGGWDDGVRAFLVGADPRDPRALWPKLKRSTFWSARTGAGHVALAGVDMALWDLAGKLHGVPVWQLLGERRNTTLRAYITVWHGPEPFRESLARALGTIDAALDAGYRAIKIEALQYNSDGWREAVELASAARDRVGPDVDLLLDVGYRFEGFEEVADGIGALDDLDLFVLEAPFHPEQTDDYRRLRDVMRTPIATGDCLTAATDYLSLLEAGLVDVVQAGAARTGISDMDALAIRAGQLGRRFLPWGWVPTALSVAANLHLCVVHDNVPLIEYAAPTLYPHSPLRHELAGPEPDVRDGAFVLPTAPGLGVEVDESVVERLRC
jgi:L-alanine-DL-glutamate epimerase-like enolase superfamily enzyme